MNTDVLAMASAVDNFIVRNAGLHGAKIVDLDNSFSLEKTSEDPLFTLFAITKGFYNSFLITLDLVGFTDLRFVLDLYTELKERYDNEKGCLVSLDMGHLLEGSKDSYSKAVIRLVLQNA